MRDMVEALVEFAYEAEQEDELSLKIGDVIKNVVQSDGGWWEGELSGKKGMFPENFVKVIKPDEKPKSAGVAKKEAPQRKSVRELASKFKDNVHLGPPPHKKKERRRKCKVMFEYVPEHEDELDLKEGEVIDFVREVEDGWWEGSKNGKSGVFPSNFVEMVEETEEVPATDVPEKSGSGDELVGSVTEIKGKKVIGIGLGNIFQGGPIKLRSSKKDGPPVEVKKPPDVKEATKPLPPEPQRAAHPEPAKHAPFAEPGRPPIPEPTEVVKREKKANRAMVRFSYAAEQPDELSLKEGETITVLDMNLEDEGWWKGEVHGKVGVFPDNFVELLPEEPPKPKKPPPPSISTIPKGPGSAKAGLFPKIPDKAPAVDPVVLETKKHDAKHDGKHKVEAPSLKNKDVPETNFESLEPTSQKLIHLTASRAKGPKKRPPSTILNQTDLEAVESPELEDISSHPPAVPSIPPPQHNDNKHHVPHKEIKQSVPEIEKKIVGHPAEHTNHHHHNAAPPRPPEPTHGTPHAAAPSLKLVEELQREMRELRAHTVTRAMFSELKTDYEKLKHEMETFKVSSTKKVRELMMEVDEEKKLRLNTQVEIERIKKLLAETNV